MNYKVAVYVFLSTLVSLRADSGLLENMTYVLNNFVGERMIQTQGNLNALGELGKQIGEDLKVLGDVIQREVKGIGEALKKKDEELEKERKSQQDGMMEVLNQIFQSLEATKKQEELSTAPDCAFLYNAGKNTSGIYRIRPDGSEGFDVYCDMEKDGGGWTVFQRRGKFETPDDYFYKSWYEYKQGFGNLEGEHWLGNDRISALSRRGTHELFIEMEDYENHRMYAHYRSFMVEGEGQLYRLHVGNFTGNVRDSMAYHNGMKFSTHDHDNDIYTNDNCAEDLLGAWWYNKCAESNLNSIRIQNKGKKVLSWQNKNDSWLDISYVQMKTRPVSF